MIDNDELENLSDEQLNYLIRQVMEEIKKLQIDIKQKEDYINSLLESLNNFV